MMQNIGEYRSLLARKPSSEVFDELIALVKNDPHANDALFSYLSAHLTRWPEALQRVLPDDDRLRVLARQPCPIATLCNTLSLRDLGLSDEDVQAVASSTDLSMIRRVDLAYNKITADGVQSLCDATHLRDVEALDLRYNNIGDRGVTALSSSSLMSSLKELYLQSNMISFNGVAELFSSDRMSSLTTLDLRYNLIGEEGARAISRSPYTRNLSRLYLYLDDVSKEGCEAIARSQSLRPHLSRVFSARAL